MKINILIFLLCIPMTFYAQIGINTDNSDPDPSAMLDVKSTDKGMLVPRMTSTQRTGISNAATGLLIYDTDTDGFWFYDGMGWVNISTGIPDRLEDIDGDTKILVNSPPDADIIRFFTGGTDYISMDRGRLDFNNGSVFIGHYAGSNDNLIASNYNVFIGHNSGFYNTSGQHNTFLGFRTGYNNTSGTGNVFLGYNAGRNSGATQSNRLYIENSNSTSPLIYGEFDNDLVRVNGDFEVTGSFPLDTAALIQDLDKDTKIQVEESADEDIMRFDLAGTEALVLKNNAAGDLMVENVSNPTGGNTLFGVLAGTNLTTTGTYNVFMGQEAGRDVVAGTKNTFIGRNSGTMHVNGNNNTFVGYFSGRNNTTGINNTIIGSQSGYNNTGSGNIFLGKSAGQNEAGSNKLYIENSSSSTPLIYGEFISNLVRINGDLQISDALLGDLTISGNTNLSGDLQIDGSLNVNGKRLVPIGAIQLWAGNSNAIPSGWLLCDGSVYDINLYSELYALLGGQYTPNLKGRFPLGVGNSNTIYSSNHTLGSIDGYEKHVISIDEMPSHNHSVDISYRQGSESGNNNPYSDLGGTATHSTTYTTHSAGDNQPHNNMPPYYTLHFIIKAD